MIFQYDSTLHLCGQMNRTSVSRSVGYGSEGHADIDGPLSLKTSARSLRATKVRQKQPVRAERHLLRIRPACDASIGEG